jgi:hypothetical protein
MLVARANKNLHSLGRLKGSGQLQRCLQAAYQRRGALALADPLRRSFNMATIAAYVCGRSGVILAREGIFCMKARTKRARETQRVDAVVRMFVDPMK